MKIKKIAAAAKYIVAHQNAQSSCRARTKNDYYKSEDRGINEPTVQGQGLDLLLTKVTLGGSYRNTVRQ